jgi:XTP/dITP diphosphohydrolase
VTLRLLLATTNPAKIREYSLLFRGSPLQLTTLAEESIEVEASETGSTLEENARMKATAYAVDNGFLVAADDSGLEVDALGGEPGPLSARFAGKNASDKERVALLLSRLAGVSWERRSARFRCVIAIAAASRVLRVFEGVCQGVIAFEPRGSQGFGYDPIFYLPELGKTMAELSIEEKNGVSHRGKAARKALRFLKKYVPGN